MRREFRRALGAVLLFLLVAVYAPYLAADRPLVCFQNEGIQFPIFRHLLDLNTFESPVDRFYNLFSLLLPLLLPLLFLKKIRRQFWFILLIVALIQTFLFVWIEQNPLRIPWENPEDFANTWQISPPIYWSPRDVDISQASPAAPGGKHWLGTDSEGRDVAARLLFGARTSLTIGLLAAVLALVAGTTIGVIAGFASRGVDRLAARLIDGMLCFPPLFLVLTFSAFVARPTVFDLLLFIAIGSWASAARLARQESRRLRDADFIRAARAQGISGPLILWRHVLPCIMPSLRVHATFAVAGAVLLESTAAFAGLSDPMLPSWGDMLNAGRISGKIWLILAPGLAVFLLVILLSRLGEALQERGRSRGWSE